ncbi:MAG: DUF3301 domain-containing protein [Pseudomonadales bacterium]
MSLDIFDLVLLLSMGAAVLYWQSSVAVKQLAMSAARRHCDETEVQLLDQTIALHRVWFKRDGKAQVRFWRSFAFEFSVDGTDRYKGKVITLGRKVTGVQLEPHRIH